MARAPRRCHLIGPQSQVCLISLKLNRYWQKTSAAEEAYLLWKERFWNFGPTFSDFRGIRTKDRLLYLVGRHENTQKHILFPVLCWRAMSESEWKPRRVPVCDWLTGRAHFSCQRCRCLDATLRQLPRHERISTRETRIIIIIIIIIPPLRGAAGRAASPPRPCRYHVARPRQRRRSAGGLEEPSVRPRCCCWCVQVHPE